MLKNGNVGIGTSTPTEELEVVGKIKGTELCIGVDCRSSWPTGGGGGGAFWATSTVDASRIYYNSGNVGIGTDNPTKKFEVNSGDVKVYFDNSTAKEGLTISNLGANGNPSLKLINESEEFTISMQGSQSELVLFKYGSDGASNPAMMIDSDKQIGIGTDYSYLPSAKLHLVESGTSDAFRVDDSDADTSPFVIDENGNVGIGDSEPDADLEVVGDFMVSGSISGNGNRFIVNSSGNVGIGDSAPDADLEVVGDFMVSSSTSGGDGNRFIVNSSGNVGIGTSTPEGKLDVHVNSYIFQESVTTTPVPVSCDCDTSTMAVNCANSFATTDPIGSECSDQVASRWKKFKVSANSLVVNSNGNVKIDGALMVTDAGYMIGDLHPYVSKTVFGDGNLDISDYITIQEIVSKHKTCNVGDPCFYAADIDKDGYITTFDAMLSIKYVSTGGGRPMRDAIEDLTGSWILKDTNGTSISLDSNQKVGIGASTQSATDLNVKLYVNGDTMINGDLTATGTAIVTASSYLYSSDKNLKENIQTIDSALDKVSQLRGVTFDWKKTGGASIGVIAQEVEEVLPELVSTNSQTGLKSVAYGNIIGVLVEAIKELEQKDQEREVEIKALKAAQGGGYCVE